MKNDKKLVFAIECARLLRRGYFTNTNSLLIRLQIDDDAR